MFDRSLNAPLASILNSFEMSGVALGSSLFGAFFAKIVLANISLNVLQETITSVDLLTFSKKEEILFPWHYRCCFKYKNYTSYFKKFFKEKRLSR